MEGGDSSGNSGTGGDPADREATEEAHRPPRGKRPPETEIINIKESIYLPFKKRAASLRLFTNRLLHQTLMPKQ